MPVSSPSPKVLLIVYHSMTGGTQQMAEAALLPAIRQRPDAIVVADGTSCRHQIADGAQREALHVARLLAQLLPTG